ncbi:MAG: alpha/beta fold hydrolase [Trueperaceae bacterium]|nr:alpha/beta fold hydrolase [Trueperaceae bacterium]
MRRLGRGLRPLIAACALLLGAALAQPNNPVARSGGYSDIATSRYREAIVDLSGRGVLSGYPDGTYRPQQQVSRAELTVLVMRMLGTSSEPGVCFRDVSSRDWFAPQVCAAKARGIVSGDAQGAFGPQRPVSYAEALKIVLSAFQIPVLHDPQAEWYVPYQNAAHLHHILPKDSYEPDALLSREVMAELIYRAWRFDIGNEAVVELRPQPVPAPVPALRGGLEPLPPPPLATTSTDDRAAAPTRRSLSSGCYRRPPTHPPEQLVVNGVTRRLIASVPEYNNNIDTNDNVYILVMAFHGRTGTAAEVRDYYNLEVRGPLQNAIILYPDGRLRDGEAPWADAGDPAEALRDYAFFEAMVELYGSSYCLDTDHVYVVGHSLGGWFANQLACARPEQVRAVASLGGSLSSNSCNGPVAAMVLHNPNDRLVSVGLGEEVRDIYLGQNGLDTRQSAAPLGLDALNCRRYGSSDASHPVLWCPHSIDQSYGTYYPHNWPAQTGPAVMAFFASLP